MNTSWTLRCILLVVCIPRVKCFLFHRCDCQLKSSQLSSSRQSTQIITNVIIITVHNLTTSHMFLLPFHYTSWRQQLKQSRTATHVLAWSLRHLRVKDPIKNRTQPSRSIYTTKLWKNKRKTHCEHSVSGYVPSIAFDVRPIRSDEEACIKEVSIVEQPTGINMGDFLYMCWAMPIHTGRLLHYTRRDLSFNWRNPQSVRFI